MIINKIIIFDLPNEEANEFLFSTGANIVLSKENTSGKSCLLKSIYYALGLQIKNFASGWDYKNMVFKIYYTNNSMTGSIIRYKDTFWVDNIDHPLSERDYSEWLSNLLNINIKLPTKRDATPERVIASAILSLFYIDQDTSWDKTPYRNTVNLGWYEFGSIPKSIFEYVLGLKSSLNIELAEKIAELAKEKLNIDNQVKVLFELRDEFISKDFSSEFDEEKIKAEIKQYLTHASILQQSISKYKSKIYSEQIKLDALKTELFELNEILKYNDKSYKKISSTCANCNSFLTTEQSLERIKISNNVLALKINIAEIEKNIAKAEKSIHEYLLQHIDIDKEYKQLMSVARIKQGELTLEQHLQNKSKEIARLKYYEIKSTLIEQSSELEAKIKKFASEEKKLIASQRRKKEKIEQNFKQIIFNYTLRFNTITLDAKFLDFKQISDSGAAKNQIFLAHYMAYTKLLIEHSSIELPLVLDSIVKDELDSDILKKIYNLVDEVLLSSQKQSFFAMLDDKIGLISNKYNIIEIDSSSRLLTKKKYLALKNEFSMAI